MAIRITEDCINCGACEIKCPNKAIYESGQKWTFSIGQTLTKFLKSDGEIVSSDQEQEPISQSVYYIVPDKCTECVGFHGVPQCIDVCPVDCCIPDENHRETKDDLATKKERMQVR